MTAPENQGERIEGFAQQLVEAGADAPFKGEGLLFFHVPLWIVRAYARARYERRDVLQTLVIEAVGETTWRECRAHPEVLVWTLGRAWGRAAGRTGAQGPRGREGGGVNTVTSLARRLIPQWARDAIHFASETLPGHGLYRPDRVRLYAEFVLQAVTLLALPHNAGPDRAAAALRRLADLLEGGEADRLSDALDPEAEAAA